MAGSVASALRASGFGAEEGALLVRALRLAFAPRVEQLLDDHHPAYLHPGRSALILLHDVGPVAVPTLALAILTESVDAGLRAPDARVIEELGAFGEALVRDRARLPRPGDEALAERLVTLEPEVALAPLAERLDHLRHLHLRPDAEDWGCAHDEVVRVWLPVAERVHARLAVRYAHWARRFARRLAR